MGPFELAGWVAELWLAMPRGAAAAEVAAGAGEPPALTAESVGLGALIAQGKLTAGADTDLAAITDGVVEIVPGFDAEEVRRSPSWRAITARFSGGYARAYFDPAHRARFVALGDRMADAAAAALGALYARCAHLPYHDAGAWFRGSDPAAAATALVYSSGHLRRDVGGRSRALAALPGWGRSTPCAAPAPRSMRRAWSKLVGRTAGASRRAGRARSSSRSPSAGRPGRRPRAAPSRASCRSAWARSEPSLARGEVNDREDRRRVAGALGEERPTAEEIELDDEGEAGDLAALLARELRRGGGRAAGREQVVHDEDPGPRPDRAPCASRALPCRTRARTPRDRSRLGSLPGLRTGTKLALSRADSAPPKMNPRDSTPTTTSMCSPTKRWARRSSVMWSARGSARSGVMSLKRIPGFGKSGTFRRCALR